MTNDEHIEALTKLAAEMLLDLKELAVDGGYRYVEREVIPAYQKRLDRLEQS